MQIEIVDAKHIGVDTAYFAPIWKINHEILTYDGAHANTECGEPQPGHDEPFFCDHAVLWLWDRMISQLVANQGFERYCRERTLAEKYGSKETRRNAQERKMQVDPPGR